MRYTAKLALLPLLTFSAGAEQAAFCEKASKNTGARFRLPTEAEWEYALSLIHI